MATIEFKQGDILHEETEALVNTVNCVGVMGRGIALQFKQRFPANFTAYAAACQRQEVVPGRMFIVETGQLAPPYYIVNFPTKRHWRGKSRIEDIQQGLQALVQEIRVRGIRSIAIPPLGSGLGGLDWAQVRPLIVQALTDLPHLRVVIYEPIPTTNQPPIQRPVPKMTPGRATLIGLMNHYLAGLMDPFISLLEVHKLVYFLQMAGEPLRLRFVQGSYGPYAENLRHVLQAVEGYYITGYGDGGDDPHKPLSIVPGATAEAEQFLTSNPSTQTHFEQVTQLVDGYETPFGLELLATVHWVVAQQPTISEQGLVHRVHAWSNRKRMFSPRQIVLAYSTLQNKGWFAS